ncbi:MAG: hypothetical protein GY826_11665 [Fuerstiella sp.]|nr:hypothetical protein [Fuerstiella sp.]
MYNSPAQLQGQFYGPLTQIWVERIRAAHESKNRFNKIAKACNDFYESQAGFMWTQKEYFNGSLPKPKFAITIAKAFEFVSIFGPHLYWQYANRTVMSQRQLKLTPQIFGDMNDPRVQQMAEQIMQQEAQEQALHNFGNEMMSTVLNWTQREQPGGLVVQGQHAVTESLIKGLGLLWPETYKPPTSEAVYTKNTFDTVNNLFIDPDCKDPLWESAGYIMRKHVNPIWQVERMFGLKRGELDGKGKVESAELRARKEVNQETKGNETFDRIEWYEIWSKVGVGPRTKQLNHHMIDMFDENVGDYAYLCIAPGVEYPLNAPPQKFYGENPATSEDVKQMFQWRCANFGDPLPAYKDNRWPVARLSYNPILGSPWPLAPLAPGLGELIALNVLTSSYVDQAWTNRQQILAYVKSASSELEQALSSDEAFVKVPLNDNIHHNINEVMQFLTRPNAQMDQLQAMEVLSQNFNRRVGLSELQYGESKTQVRVAADSRQKAEAISIRPEKMSGDVARFMTEASQLEMFLAAMHMQGRHLTHLLGGFGASQWDQYFSQMPLEQLMREAKTTVEASEVRRPNKERDTANIQALQQFLMPLLQQFAQDTTNTEPINEFIGQVAEAMDMQKAPVQLPPWQPPVDPQQQQIQQMLQQLEMKKTQAETTNKEAGAQKAMADAAATMIESQVPGGMIDEMKHEQELRHTEESHTQDLIHNEQQQYQDLLFADLTNDQDLAAKKQQAAAGSSNPK